MRLMTKTLSILAVLTILLMTPALAATAKPVLGMTYKVAPGSSVMAAGSLMPGDTGTVVVTIANTQKSAGSGTQTTQSDTYNYPSSTSNTLPTSARTSTTTTVSSDAPSGSIAIKSVSLQDNGPVRVTSQSYSNTGSLGMGDSTPFVFTIKVDDNAADGMYFLPITVKTDDDGVFLNLVVPVVVDSSGVRMFLNDAPSALSTARNSIILDVVNYMQGGVNSVSVVPTGDEFTFKPRQEYVVGNIGAGEMYTVNFDVSSKNSSYTGSPTFVVKYKNGDNWHQSAALTLPLTAKANTASASTNDSGLMYLALGIVVVAIIVGGLFLFMRSQRAKK
jgi:hypothetical protein